MQQGKSPTPSRRGFVTGTMTIGAAAAAASSVAPFLGSDRQPPTVQPQPKPERGGGYSLSEHVKRYYRTTLV